MTEHHDVLAPPYRLSLDGGRVPAMSGPGDVIARMIDRYGSILLRAVETLTDEEFFAELVNGHSVAWTVGHMACVADLFSLWFDGNMLFDQSVHATFNETEVTAGGPCEADRVDPEVHPKEMLLFRFRQAHFKALQTLARFDPQRWDMPGPAGIPRSMMTGGTVWEILAAHVVHHLGELSGTIPRFRGTYIMNVADHYFYDPEN